MRVRARDQRGFAIVEAAFVTPVFFTLVLGICEIGLAMNDYLAISSAVRAGSRTASTTGTDVYSDYWTLKAIKRDATAIQANKIQRIVIYRANAFGDPPTASCRAGTPTTGTGANHVGACNVYSYTDLTRTKNHFGCISGQNLDRYWCPNQRKVTLSSGGTDYVGVWIRYKHNWLTKMFGSTKTLEDTSVTRLEPRANT